MFEIKEVGVYLVREYDWCRVSADGLDFGKECFEDFVGSLEVAFGETLGDPFLVGRRDIRHVVAGLQDLGLVGRVLDVVLDVFELGL